MTKTKDSNESRVGVDSSVASSVRLLSGTTFVSKSGKDSCRDTLHYCTHLGYLRVPELSAEHDDVCRPPRTMGIQRPYSSNLRTRSEGYSCGFTHLGFWSSSPIPDATRSLKHRSTTSRTSSVAKSQLTRPCPFTNSSSPCARRKARC